MAMLSRKLIAMAAAGALQWAAFLAPFMHVHLDDHVTAHHAGHAMHAHLSEHAQHATHHDGLEIEVPDDDRAIYPQVFVAVEAGSVELPAIVADTFQVPVAAERSAQRPIDVAHGHDPPVIASLPPRAPPVLPS